MTFLHRRMIFLLIFCRLALCFLSLLEFFFFWQNASGQPNYFSLLFYVLIFFYGHVYHETQTKIDKYVDYRGTLYGFVLSVNTREKYSVDCREKCASEKNYSKNFFSLLNMPMVFSFFLQKRMDRLDNKPQRLLGPV
jgi:hypothetical protein